MLQAGFCDSTQLNENSTVSGLVAVPSRRRIIVATVKIGPAWFRGQGACGGSQKTCPTRSMTYARIGRSAPGSTTPNIARCTRVRSRTRTGSGPSRRKRVDWIKPFTKVKNTSFAPGKVSIKWFEDGMLNAAYNCVDRHLAKRGDQTAIIWEGDDPKQPRQITYRELHAEVCKIRQCPEGAQRQEGRPRHHLSADDRGSRLRNARLRAHRRDPFGGVRRLLARIRSPAASRDCKSTRHHHLRRGPARRPQDRR